jgi:Ca2+-binding RTX toxin-like protein
MFTTTAHGHRHLRRVALLAGLPLVMVGIATTPAQAQAVVQCGGFNGPPAGYIGFVGGPGPDVYVGPAGAAVWAVGLGGNDTITTSSDLDIVCGNDGDDTITTNGSRDNAWGGAGNDRVSLGAGPDFAEGGPGNDDISGGLDNDVLYGDTPPGGPVPPPPGGADTLRGNDGDDELRGGPLADILLGNAGDDSLFGDGGIDELNGGADVDDGDGGPGADTCQQIENPLSPACP